MVLSILGLPTLVNQELYTVWRWPQEAQAPQMPHLLAVLVVEALGEVYGMV